MVVLLHSCHVIPLGFIYHWRITRAKGPACPLHCSFPQQVPHGVVGEWQLAHEPNLLLLGWWRFFFFPPGNIFKPRISVSTSLLRERALLSLVLQLWEKKRFIGRKYECICAPYHARQADKRRYRKNYCVQLLVHDCTGSFTLCSHTQSCVFQAKRLPGWEIMEVERDAGCVFHVYLLV